MSGTSHRRASRSTPSQISVSSIPMHEVEPSPVEETPAKDEQDMNGRDDPTSYFPSNGHISGPERQGSSTSTLGLSSSSITKALQALQKYSTYPFLAFATMHITNTSLIPLITRNLHTSDTYLLLTRPYYQSPLMEPIMIFAPIAIHVFSGVALRVYRRRIIARRHGAETYKERRSIPWPKLSVQSALGYLLYPFVVGHMFLNRLLPLKEEGGSSGVGLRYVAHSMTKQVVIANLLFATLVGLASFHLVGGMAKWLKVSQEYVLTGGDYGARRKKRRGWIVNGLSAAVALVWIAGGLGVVGRGGPGTGWEAKHWDELLGKVPIVGKWI